MVSPIAIMPITPPPVWITPHESGWQVKREGADRASRVTQTQEQAWDAGNQIAKREKTEVYLTGKNGRIRLRNSHGNDPRYIPG